MRGKAPQVLINLTYIRITPAYAGKSHFHHLAISIYLGSPPPMRGKVFGKLANIGDDRITPAYAGKSKKY